MTQTGLSPSFGSRVQVTVENLKRATSIVDSPSPLYNLSGPIDLTEGMEVTFEDETNRHDDPMEIPGLHTQLGKRPTEDMANGSNNWKKYIKVQPQSGMLALALTFSPLPCNKLS